MTTPSHGKLIQHDLTASGALREASLRDLGLELLRRLQTNAPDDGSRVAYEDQLAMLTALRDAAEARLEVPENRLSLAQLAGRFRFVRHCHRQHGVPLQGAVHVDIGCGASHPFARMFTHLLAGVQRAYCIDLDAPRDLAESVRRLPRIASAAIVDPPRLFGDLAIRGAEILQNLAGFDLARLQQGDVGGLAAERLTFLRRSIADTGLAPASVDVTISNSVLEHMPDVDATLAELARITKPGGFGLHGIDTVDHRWYGNPGLHPLEFLTLDSRERIVHECNRLRPFQFEARFEHHGFRIVDRWLGNPVAITPELRARLVEPWRSMTDAQLATTWTQFAVRRL